MSEIYYAVLICDFGSLINIYGMKRTTTAYKMSLNVFNTIVNSTSLDKHDNFLYSGTDPDQIYNDCCIFMEKIMKLNNDRTVRFPIKHFVICNHEELEYYDPSIVEYNIGNHNPDTIILSRGIKNMVRDSNNCQHHSFSYNGERIVYYVVRNHVQSKLIRNKNPYLELLHQSIYLTCIKASDPAIAINTSQNHRFEV